MKINRIKTSNNRKKLIGALLVIIALGLLIGVAYSLTRQSSTPSEATPDTPNIMKPATEEEIKTGDSIKESAVKESPNEETKNDGTVTIHANIAGDQLKVLTQISSVISDGSCSISLSKGSEIVNESTVGIQPLPSYSTCKGWTIPLSKLSSGEWAITVTVSSTTVNSTATTKVTIQ